MTTTENNNPFDLSIPQHEGYKIVNANTTEKEEKSWEATDDYKRAIKYADNALDEPYADPDDEIRTISRQFFRQIERTDYYMKLLSHQQEELIRKIEENVDSVFDLGLYGTGLKDAYKSSISIIKYNNNSYEKTRNVGSNQCSL